MPIIQLQPHPITSLPHHPDLETGGPSRPLQEHIRATLEEAHEILESLPSDLRAESKLRKSPPSDAKVKLSQGWRTPLHSDPNAQKEYWVSRESEHEDSSRSNGSATWQEFQNGLHQDHAYHEMEYTPSVTRVVQLFNWAEGEDDHLDQDINTKNTRYKQFNVQLFLIIHTFNPSRLIHPRAFLSFTISATTQNLLAPDHNTPNTRHPTEGFITIQVPYSIDNPGPNPAFVDYQYHGLYSRITSNIPPRTVFAHYASIERVELLVLPTGRSMSISGQGEGVGEGGGELGITTPSTLNTPASSTGRRVKWTMATTSDAGGKIPGWVQRSWMLGGIPKAVVADVGLFIGWVIKRRRVRDVRQEEHEEER
ncbi:hypothetical protein N7499_005905 [Penicillium canescens]|nr:hypothetical protein N7499_005905 [Penicillium canescens]KAJ6177172.1 hypothetical protein N7485_004086 [Penicillium canescens]